MRHRSLFKNKTYVFESFVRINLTIENFIIAINAIINSDQKVISMSNFNFISIKILKDQILKTKLTIKESFIRDININAFRFQ